MTWVLTQRLADFISAADEYLRAEPVRNTVPLTVLEALRQRGLSAYADNAPLFGWHESQSGVADGAFLQTPPHPLLVAGLPPAASPGLVKLIAGRKPGGASLADTDATEFGAAWAAVTGGSATIVLRMRLFRLGQLAPPEPFPPGAARLAAGSDLELLLRWNDEFVAETGAGGEDSARTVADRLSYDGITLWEDGGEPVAMATLTRHVAGVCRLGSVYTPPGCRRRGYGAAVTTAASRRALDQGAAAVVLYTDVANPASNALYQRLGFRPAGDRIALELT
jgi:ribosomal protein S18 acetylase RimI-like enzyme